MAHNINWDNEAKTVVLQEFLDPVSKDDLYHIAQKSAQMLNGVDHIVHLIMDERKVNYVLNSADMAYLERLTPKNQGAVIVVVPQQRITYKNVVRSLGERISPNAFDNVYFVETIEEARTFLVENFDVDYPSRQEG